MRIVARRRKQGLIGQGYVGSPMRVRLFSIDAAGAGHDIAISRRGWRPKLCIYEALMKKRAQGKPGAHDTRSRAHKNAHG
jgi:hypothetical protein